MFGMSTLDTIILVIGTFYVSIWTTRILSLIYRSFYGVHCTTQRYGEKSWALVAGI
jgi:hypothetical protein